MFRIPASLFFSLLFFRVFSWTRMKFQWEVATFPKQWKSRFQTSCNLIPQFAWDFAGKKFPFSIGKVCEWILGISQHIPLSPVTRGYRILPFPRWSTSQVLTALFIFLFAVATSFSIILPSGTKKLGKPSLHRERAQGDCWSQGWGFKGSAYGSFQNQILWAVSRADKEPCSLMDRTLPLRYHWGNACTCNQNHAIKFLVLQIMGRLKKCEVVRAFWIFILATCMQIHANRCK